MNGDVFGCRNANFLKISNVMKYHFSFDDKIQFKKVKAVLSLWAA